MMWRAEFLNTHYLDNWTFGIHTDKTILRIPMKKRNVGNTNLHIYSGHRWKKTAGEFDSGFSRYNNFQHMEK